MGYIYISSDIGSTLSAGKNEVSINPLENNNNINIQQKNPKKLKKSRLIQFYSANVAEDESDLPCMDKWTNSMKSQIIFIKNIIDYCLHIPENKWATKYKVMIGLLATVSYISNT